MPQVKMSKNSREDDHDTSKQLNDLVTSGSSTDSSGWGKPLEISQPTSSPTSTSSSESYSKKKAKASASR